eukprot:TRINITY_DN511_c0_g1_i1.p1 TRINITY_DN511_c0_g1~~TRINITY_DN511_c0_g1_i1.p1  ORF type:complete len:354 (+),score=50.95 TRINITY_DN511_c0_g1_i1:524-1585(+)
MHYYDTPLGLRGERARTPDPLADPDMLVSQGDKFWGSKPYRRKGRVGGCNLDSGVLRKLEGPNRSGIYSYDAGWTVSELYFRHRPRERQWSWSTDKVLWTPVWQHRPTQGSLGRLASENAAILRALNACQGTPPKFEAILVGDRDIDVAFMFHHYSFSYWTGIQFLESGKIISTTALKRNNPHARKVAAAELVNNPGWTATEKRSTCYDPESVGVAEIVYNEERSTRVRPLTIGAPRTNLRTRWAQIMRYAKTYPYAEQGPDLRRTLTPKKWPQSRYITGDDVNNSNTFVRAAVKSVYGYTLREFPGSHPGRWLPRRMPTNMFLPSCPAYKSGSPSKCKSYPGMRKCNWRGVM